MNVSLPNAIVRNRLRVAECRTHVMPSGEWHSNACYNSRVDKERVNVITENFGRFQKEETVSHLSFV